MNHQKSGAGFRRRLYARETGIDRKRHFSDIGALAGYLQGVIGNIVKRAYLERLVEPIDYRLQIHGRKLTGPRR
jgi:hypothetical protein